MVVPWNDIQENKLQSTGTIMAGAPLCNHRCEPAGEGGERKAVSSSQHEDLCHDLISVNTSEELPI